MVQRSLLLAEQVRLQVLQWIRDEHLDDDVTLPSEAQLAERLGVSRATVRDALSRLEQDRIVIRRHGSGTYVNPAVAQLNTGLDHLLDPAELIERQGHRATADTPEFRRTTADPQVAEALSLPEDHPVLDVSVLYRADSQPALWLQGVIPLDPEAALPAFIHLASFAGQLTGLAASYSLATLEPIPADEVLARRLDLPPGTPLLCLADVHLTDEGQPAFYSRVHFAPGRLRLQLLRNRDGLRGSVAIW